jgi:hypothetical protein
MAQASEGGKRPLRVLHLFKISIKKLLTEQVAEAGASTPLPQPPAAVLPCPARGRGHHAAPPAACSSSGSSSSSSAMENVSE